MGVSTKRGPQLLASDREFEDHRARLQKLLYLPDEATRLVALRKLFVSYFRTEYPGADVSTDRNDPIFFPDLIAALPNGRRIAVSFYFPVRGAEQPSADQEGEGGKGSGVNALYDFAVQVRACGADEGWLVTPHSHSEDARNLALNYNATAKVPILLVSSDTFQVPVGQLAIPSIQAMVLGQARVHQILRSAEQAVAEFESSPTKRWRADVEAEEASDGADRELAARILAALSPDDLERVAAEIMSEEGYLSVTVHGTTRDGGKDVTGYQGSLQAVAQCKRHSKALGVRALASIVGGFLLNHAETGILFAPYGLTRSGRIFLNRFQRACDLTLEVRTAQDILAGAKRVYQRPSSRERGFSRRLLEALGDLPARRVGKADLESAGREVETFIARVRQAATHQEGVTEKMMDQLAHTGIVLSEVLNVLPPAMDGATMLPELWLGWEDVAWLPGHAIVTFAPGQDAASVASWVRSQLAVATHVSSHPVRIKSGRHRDAGEGAIEQDFNLILGSRRAGRVTIRFEPSTPGAVRTQVALPDWVRGLTTLCGRAFDYYVVEEREHELKDRSLDGRALGG